MRITDSEIVERYFDADGMTHDLVVRQTDRGAWQWLGAGLELLRPPATRQRTVLLRLHAAGFPYEETARSLGLSRRTVERQTMRGFQKLRAASAAS